MLCMHLHMEKNFSTQTTMYQFDFSYLFIDFGMLLDFFYIYIFQSLYRLESLKLAHTVYIWTGPF